MQADRHRPHDHQPAEDTFQQLRDKTCPRCGETWPTTPEHWYLRSNKRIKRCRGWNWHEDGTDPTPCEWSDDYLHWFTSGYCRHCANKATTSSQRIRRNIDHFTPEEQDRILGAGIMECACCKRRGRGFVRLMPGQDPVPMLYRVCPEDRQKLTAASFSYQEAMVIWKHIRFHLDDEERLEREWRSDRKRRPHTGSKTCPPGTRGHMWCVRLELEWRKVVTFLARMEKTPFTDPFKKVWHQDDITLIS